MSLGLGAEQTEVAAEMAPTADELVAGIKKTVEIDWSDGELRISEHWFRWHYLAAVVFAGFFIVFTIRSIAELPMPDFHLVLDEPLTFLLIVGGVLGFGLVYYLVAGLINTTYITVTDDRLVCRIRPLPWVGYFDLQRDEIDQFYVAQGYRWKERAGCWDWSGDPRADQGPDFGGFSLQKYKRVPYYVLVVKTHHGREHQISIRYVDAYTPRVIEYLLERQLGIADRFVAKEYRGD